MNNHESNKLIAEFMGEAPNPMCESIKKDGYTHCKYHSSWDWLMPVVIKINSLNYKIAVIHYFHGHSYEISKANIKHTYPHNEALHGLYKTVVEFIQWYNENK